MLKIKISIFILLLTSSLFTTAQKDSNSRVYGIKVNYLINYDKVESVSYFEPTNTTTTSKDKNIDLGRLSFSLILTTRNKWNHEIEVVPLKVVNNDVIVERYYHDTNQNITIEGDYNKVTSFSSRYILSRNLLNRKFIEVGLGLGLNYEFFRDKNEPAISSSYDRVYTKNDFAGIFVPSFSYKPIERLNCSISLILKIANYGFSKQYVANPAVPINQQENKVNEFETFPKSGQLKFSLMYTISK